MGRRPGVLSGAGSRRPSVVLGRRAQAERLGGLRGGLRLRAAPGSGAAGRQSISGPAAGGCEARWALPEPISAGTPPSPPPILGAPPPPSPSPPGRESKQVLSARRAWFGHARGRGKAREGGFLVCSPSGHGRCRPSRARATAWASLSPPVLLTTHIGAIAGRSWVRPLFHSQSLLQLPWHNSEASRLVPCVSFWILWSLFCTRKPE